MATTVVAAAAVAAAAVAYFMMKGQRENSEISVNRSLSASSQPMYVATYYYVCSELTVEAAAALLAALDAADTAMFCWDEGGKANVSGFYDSAVQF